MNIHHPGFMVAERYRDRLVAAGVIDAEPQQQLSLSDGLRTSDAPVDGDTTGASSDGGPPARTGAPTGYDVRPPARVVPAVSQSPAEGPVVDLMAALEESVAAAKAARAGGES